MKDITLKDLVGNEELLEVAKRAVEDTLIDFRDSRLSVVSNNGLVIKEKDGRDSHIIRFGIDHAINIGLKAILEHLDKK